MDKPLKSVTHGQFDTRPTVTFPVAGHCCPVTDTKLYCLVTEAHVCEQLAQGRYLTAKRPGVELATSRVASQRPSHYNTRPHRKEAGRKLKQGGFFRLWALFTMLTDIRLSANDAESLLPRLHNTTNRLYTRYSRLSKRLLSWFDNRLV